MSVIELENPNGYGRVLIHNGEVQEIVEQKDCTPEQLAVKTVNAGIYMLNPEALALIPHGRYLDMPDLVNRILEQGMPVGSFPIHEYWIDIGQMQEFQQAHEDYDEKFTSGHSTTIR